MTIGNESSCESAVEGAIIGATPGATETSNAFMTSAGAGKFALSSAPKDMRARSAKDLA